MSMRQKLAHATCHRVVLGGGTVEALGDCPEQSEHEQYAHERRQVGKIAEYGDEDESAHTEEEHRAPLPSGEYRHIVLRQVLSHIELSLQRELQYEYRHHHRHERRQEQFCQHSARCYHALYPQHDGRNVSYGRERASRVGGYYHYRGEYHALLVVAYELAQHHNHHDGRGEIVEYGREEERHEGDAPQQFALATGLHDVAHEVESAIGVHNLHDGHRSHEEEQSLGSVAEVHFQNLAHMRGYRPHAFRRTADGGGEILSGVCHVCRPAQYAHEKRHCRLVHFGETLCRYAHISGNEDKYYRQR